MIIDCGTFGGACSCGRIHDIVTKTAVIEAGALLDIDSHMRTQGITGRRCALYGSRSYQATAGRRPAAEQEIVLPAEGLHADERAVGAVLEQMEAGTDIIIAVGGGTVNDIARYTAYKLGLRFVSVPTAASVDGFCSSVAAMTWYGFKTSLTAKAPELVVADLDVICAAPQELWKSGVGDILAKFTALADWRIAHSLTGEYLCPEIYGLVMGAASSVLELAGELPSGDMRAFGELTRALLISGIAMQLMGNSRPASGAEHHISHLIEMHPAGLPVCFDALHGEKTGVGSVLTARTYRALTEQRFLRLDRDLAPSDEEVRAFFGPELGGKILRENDCLGPVSEDGLARAWPAICEAVAQIPSPERLELVLKGLGAKYRPEDIGVDCRDTELLLRFSPLVRDRLTLMRLRQIIKNGDASA